jgi:hypothetical protein
MNTQILASLEEAISGCLDKAAESSENWPDGYQSPSLVVKMAGRFAKEIATKRKGGRRG